MASSAMDRSRWGLLFLAAGMAVAFTLTGVLVASLGFSLGFDGSTLRYGAALLMLLVALWLLNSRIQAWMSLKTSALTGHGQTWLSAFQPRSAAGQLIVGLLLGLVWTPVSVQPGRRHRPGQPRRKPAQRQRRHAGV
ncbi:hypothetical protein O0544_16165 [Edwardsiella anguillarum]|nr:hypothetical protein [Edwardsiella anguillarum]